MLCVTSPSARWIEIVCGGIEFPIAGRRYPSPLIPPSVCRLHFAAGSELYFGLPLFRGPPLPVPPPPYSQDCVRNEEDTAESDPYSSGPMKALQAALAGQDDGRSSAVDAGASASLARDRAPLVWRHLNGQSPFPLQRLAGKAPRSRFNLYGTGGDADFVPPQPVAPSNGLQVCASSPPPPISSFLVLLLSWILFFFHGLGTASLQAPPSLPCMLPCFTLVGPVTCSRASRASPNSFPRVLASLLPSSRLPSPSASFRACG